MIIKIENFKKIKKLTAVFFATVIALCITFFAKDLTGDRYFSVSLNLDDRQAIKKVTLVLTDERAISFSDKSSHIKEFTKEFSDNNILFKLSAQKVSSIEKLTIKINLIDTDKKVLKISNLKINKKPVKLYSVKAFEDGFYTLDKVNKNSDSKTIDLNNGFLFKLNDGNIAICILDELKANPISGNYSFFGIFIIFFSVFSISYLLIRFLLSRKATEKAKSSDILFIIAVIITLLIPVLLLNTKENAKDLSENRMLSSYKSAYTTDPSFKINLNFMKDFENYFNDRFGLRNQFIKLKQLPEKSSLNRLLSSFINKENSAFCQSDGWCFLNNKDGETEMCIFDRQKKFAPDTTLLKEIVKRTDKQIILLVNPLKTEIYPEKVKIFKEKKDPLWYFSDYAYDEFSKIKADNLTVINVKNLLVEAKKSNPDALVYFKDEHHMTEYGNYIIIKYLINNLPAFSKLKANFNIDSRYKPILKQIASGEFIDNPNVILCHGQTYGMIFGMKQRFKKGNFAKPVEYPMYSFSDNYLKDVTIKRDPKCDANIHLHNSMATDFKVYVYANSFVETFSKVMATSAKDVYRARVNTSCGAVTLTNSDSVIDEINKINPDVIVIPYWQHTF